MLMSRSSPPPLQLVDEPARGRRKPLTPMGERMEERRRALELDKGEVIELVCRAQGKPVRPAYWHDWSTKDPKKLEATSLVHLARALRTTAEWLLLGEHPTGSGAEETLRLVRVLKEQLNAPIADFDERTLSSVVFHVRQPTSQLLHVWYQTLTSIAPLPGSNDGKHRP